MTATCCQLADDETIANDPQEFNCRACVVMERVLELDETNVAAWGVYRRLCNRFVNDIQAGSMLLARLTDGQDSEEFGETCERLRVIYDVLQPPKAK